jgi:3-carboxy-cis,cis-muconate cycloisomerase
VSRFLEDYAFDPPELRVVFDDAGVIAHALAFESALARARCAAGQLSADEAVAIANACAAFKAPPEDLAAEAAHAGTLAIALVARLRALAPSLRVHEGAASQDLADSIVALQLKQAIALINGQSARVVVACAGLARSHTATPMLARTLMQPALGISFGLRCANWMAAIAEASDDLAAAAQAGLRLQLGGGAGARHGLDGQSAFIAKHMSESLGVSVSAVPDHARRGGRARLGCALAVLCGGLGKIARDIAIMSQAEIAEIFEPRSQGRGGSSSMPHKNNATASQVALTAAHRAPGIAVTLLTGLPQECERGLSGWQAEGPALASLCRLAFTSGAALAHALEGLDVRVETMARNLSAAGISVDLGESHSLVQAALAQYGERR